MVNNFLNHKQFTIRNQEKNKKRYRGRLCAQGVLYLKRRRVIRSVDDILPEEVALLVRDMPEVYVDRLLAEYDLWRPLKRSMFSKVVYELNNKPFTWKAQETMARQLCCTRQELNLVLNELVRAGYINKAKPHVFSVCILGLPPVLRNLSFRRRLSTKISAFSMLCVGMILSAPEAISSQDLSLQVGNLTLKRKDISISPCTIEAKSFLGGLRDLKIDDYVKTARISTPGECPMAKNPYYSSEKEKVFWLQEHEADKKAYEELMRDSTELNKFVRLNAHKIESCPLREYKMQLAQENREINKQIMKEKQKRIAQKRAGSYRTGKPRWKTYKPEPYKPRLPMYSWCKNEKDRERERQIAAAVDAESRAAYEKNKERNLREARERFEANVYRWTHGEWPDGYKPYKGYSPT